MKSEFKANLLTPILIMVVFGLVLTANFLPQDVLGADENPYLSVVLVQILTYALPALFYCRLRGKTFTPKLRLRLFPPSQILYLLYSFIFLLTGGMLISMLMYSAFPASFAASSVTEYAAFAMNDRAVDVLYLIVAFAVLPAVTEEFLFRGIVVGEYDRWGATVAAVMSAILFAMSHFSLVRFPVYFFSGLVLSAVLFTTRSLVASMVLHGAYNALILLCEKYVLHIMDKQNVSLTLFVIILGGVFLLSAMLICYEAQSIYHGYSDKNIPSDYADLGKKSAFARIAEAFFTPTFLILVILFVITVMTRA